jgi:hypothetical protein
MRSIIAGSLWAPRPAYGNNNTKPFAHVRFWVRLPIALASILLLPVFAIPGLLAAGFSCARLILFRHLDQYALRPLINDLAGKMTIALRLLPQEIRLHVARVGRWGHVQPLILRTALVRTATNSGRLCPRRSRAKSSPAVPVRGYPDPTGPAAATQVARLYRLHSILPRFHQYRHWIVRAAQTALVCATRRRFRLDTIAPADLGFIDGLALRSGIESRPGVTASRYKPLTCA